jgi:hypothetical protein
MRIAICFSGMFRHFELTINSLKENILHGCDNIYDIYGHFWKNSENDSRLFEEIINPIEKNITLKNVKFEYFEEDKFSERATQFKIKRPETKVINVISMWYKIYESLLLVEEDYDYIIRCRTDNIYYDKLDYKNLDNLKLNIPFFENNAYDISYTMNAKTHNTIFDMFAISNKSIMKTYSEMYNNLEFLYQNGSVFHPETLLFNHIQVNKLPVNRFNFNIRVIQSDGTLNRIR